MKKNPFITLISFFIILVSFFLLLSEQKNVFAEIHSIYDTSVLEVLTLDGDSIIKVRTKQKELAENLNFTSTASHIKTPEKVRALYMSSWVAGTPSVRDGILKIIDESEDLNALVVDIKDSTGVVSFEMQTPLALKYGTGSTRIADIEGFVNLVHEKNIYLIGRISTFQDPVLTEKRNDWALKRIDNGGIWKDNNGLAFIDPGKSEAWEYIKEISLEAYRIGFDEINFDYIRYPSDGPLRNLNYALSEGETRVSSLRKFFQYLDLELRQNNNIPISADIFGLATSAEDDLGIGQFFEEIYPYFDYIAPMVYPSHYGPGTFGFPDPEVKPYEVVKMGMESAIRRATALGIMEDQNPYRKLRTWIQDFSLRVPYGLKEVTDQIKASREIGIDSFMVWNASNIYTKKAY